MQLPRIQTPYFYVYLKNKLQLVKTRWHISNKIKWYLAVFVLVGILMGTIWNVQSARLYIQKITDSFKVTWFGQKTEQVVLTSPIQSKVTSEQRIAVLEEQVQNLELKLTALDKNRQILEASFSRSQTELKDAIAEVARVNDLLNNQQAGWLDALKKVGISVDDSGKIADATNTQLEDGNVAKKININKASSAELDALPGIGPTYAQKIIAYRDEKGGFKSIEDLQNVPGIGPATFAKLKDLIDV